MMLTRGFVMAGPPFLTTKFEYYYYHTPAAPGLQERRTVAVL
ncbi:hypothetical protein FAEPRAM212_00242 [Faecalibacterium prausnitzii M21/2]|uniref:Uncharacterized protein n=1 Tax=Faecalibacterium prausnitzii M21/2 TaxID=411485 RepID=A8S6L9_9FIRM|nr:hypothetical protein FAEPRAM212_00242 [Faecalibacterium prausnitzii M21/2]